MGAAPQYPGSSRPTNHSGAGHFAGSGPAHGQAPQGGASPVGNPQGNIQAGPGSPLAGADLGRSGFVQPGSGQGFVDHSGRLVRPGDQGPWQAQGGPGGQIAQPGSQAMGPGGQPMGPGGVPGQPWAPMTYRRIRRGGWVLFALIVMTVAVMPLSPLVICIIALLWSILARTGTRLDRKVQRYRFERGMESGGFGRALASAPGAVLASALTSIASFILPAIAAVATLVLVRLDIAGLVPSGGSEQWSVWAAGAAGALVLWVGPGASSLRHGSRLLVSGATRNQLGRLIALAVAVLLLLLGVMVIQSGASMSWWPLPINPFDYLPGPV